METVQSSGIVMRPELSTQLDRVKTTCINCPKCVEQCAFLKENGKPGEIAGDYDPANPEWLTLSFQCSLCGLCAAVCPVNLAPQDMFLEMRREAVDRGAAPLPAHRGIMAYERRGVSRKYSWYSLPERCDTVFFPGCAFSGTRMDTTLAIYDALKTMMPDLGMVLDCCCKPSHDLGRNDYFSDMFGEMRDYLTSNSVKNVVVACPNCYKVFKQYGNGLAVSTVYTVLAENPLPRSLSDNLKPGSRRPSAVGLSDGHADALPILQDSGLLPVGWAKAKPCISETNMLNPTPLSRRPVSVHDPCVLRDEPGIQLAVRALTALAGFNVTDMPHSGETTVCCGEGGTVGCVASQYPEAWKNIRKTEAKGRRLITYCAGCAGFLNKVTPTDHILDALVYPDQVAKGGRKAVRAPWTYMNRLRLKRYIQTHYPAAVTRQRDYTPASARLPGKGSALKKILLTAIVAAVAAGLHMSGLTARLDPETLRRAVAAWGMMAPLIYILIYTLAPALLLPGLPITLTGGIVFGPFWGVVYSIVGATTGASFSFFIARYVARDWVQARLSGPKWKTLNVRVEQNGWKIVAFTRLVPVFPFNLQNYAYGLTTIPFSTYVVTSFICMLPACAALIVFSSSFLDLIKGRVSPGFIFGLGLIVLVSLIPLAVRRYTAARGGIKDEP